MKVIATLWNGKRYLLKHDDLGYFWDGMREASFRRKTWIGIIKVATHCQINVVSLIDE